MRHVMTLSKVMEKKTYNMPDLVQQHLENLNEGSLHGREKMLPEVIGLLNKRSMSSCDPGTPLKTRTQ